MDKAPRWLVVVPVGVMDDPDLSGRHVRAVAAAAPDGAMIVVVRATAADFRGHRRAVMDAIDACEDAGLGVALCPEQASNEAEAINAVVEFEEWEADLLAVVSERVSIKPGTLEALAAGLRSETVKLDADEMALERPRPTETVLAGPAGQWLPGLQRILGFVNATPWLCSAIDDRCWVADLARIHALLPDDALLQPRFGGHALRSLCVQLARVGVGVVTVPTAHVEARDLVEGEVSPEPDVGERLAMYDAYRTRTPAGVKVAAMWRFGPEVPNDLHLLRASVQRAAMLCDAVVVLLARNPLEVTQTEAWTRLVQQGEAQADRLGKGTAALMRKLAGASALDAGRAFREWLEVAVRQVTASGNRAPAVFVRVKTDGGGEREDRARLLRIAVEDAECDWALCLDHDEIVEERVGRPLVERLCGHPNPLVRSWDVGVLHHWDGHALVRTDGPFGGDHAARLVRLGLPGEIVDGNAAGIGCSVSPPCGPSGRRVSGVRLHHLGFARAPDRQRRLERLAAALRVPSAREPQRMVRWAWASNESAMKVERHEQHDGVGLHMLLYEEEDPADVARWLDAVHGVVDRVVLVWTGEWAEADKRWTLRPDDEVLELGARSVNAPVGMLAQFELEMDPDIDVEAVKAEFERFKGEDTPIRIVSNPDVVDLETAPRWPSTGPGRDLARLAVHHGCEWVHQPLDDDLATARNAGMEALQDADYPPAWALFVDPDEWLENDERDCRAVRRMAEASQRWGWLWRVANHRREGVVVSESVRMSRLDPDRLMRMDGRVHEGFLRAGDAVEARGHHLSYGYAPFVLQHQGGWDDARQAAKLDKYAHLLRLELEERPDNPGAWVSLAWHHRNNGYPDLEEECLRRAVAVAGDTFLPYRELALRRLRQGRDLMRQCLERLSPGHDYKRHAKEAEAVLSRIAPDPHVIPHRQLEPPDPLPSFPLDDVAPSEE